MSRQRPLPQYETRSLRPKWKRPEYTIADEAFPVDKDLVIWLLAVTAFLVLLGLAFLSLSTRKSRTLPNVPRVGRDKRKWFSKLRARTWTTINYEAALKDAYKTYSKNDQSCILSGLDGDTVVLPPSAIQWLINLPDTIISTDESSKNVLQTKYSFTVPEIMDRTIHFDVIKGELTRQVFHLTDVVNDELKTAVDDIFGIDTEEFKSVGLFDAITKVVARINNRVFVGLPLCRDQTYLSNAIGFAEDVVLSATLLRLVPPWLRFFLAPFVTISNKLHARGYTKMIRPEILRRQRLLSTSINDKEALSSENDYLSWLLSRSPPGFQSNVKTLIARMLHLNFASIHTTSFIGTNAIFDLLSHATLQPSSPTSPSPAYIDQILNEIAPLEPLDRRALQKMHLTDACLRESSRLASIIGLGVNVKVVAEEGVTAPDGTHCAKGAFLSVPSWAIHNDEELYPDPLVFRPERYLTPQHQNDIQDLETSLPPTEKVRTYLTQANRSFTSTSPAYLAFGHGRHACPGRFFAAQELKLLLAYLLRNYEMKLEDKGEDGGRVRNMWMGPNHVPPLKARVGVRRKRVEKKL